MNEPIDPPRLCESMSDVPADVRELLAFARQDSLSDEAASRIVEGALDAALSAGAGSGAASGTLAKLAAKVGLLPKLTLLGALSVGVAVWVSTPHPAPTATRTAPSLAAQLSPSQQAESPAHELPTDAPALLAPILPSALPSAALQAPPVQPLRRAGRPHQRKHRAQVATISSAHHAVAATPSPEALTPEPAKSRPEIAPAPASNAERVPSALEVQLIREARSRLATRPARTLELVTQHRAQFPASVLAQEREALEIEALVGLDRGERARAAAREFERRHPTSPLRMRVRTATAGPATHSP